ncbi:MAG: hypothetical protein OMM_03586 [Candidatus Magnetoglobus multicellularis str. Araruama]|uniref:Uncharacterized protein n=1 Tax=Candidatus Magnetoglobus multicellularis str. Araruama TaxID=890399 RepID=A0A1V1P5C4_9BACT|nr:MAG: hypothetical protein OMM_03586 [Candidatus Magnetoglobus multicellularis str. Araruama]
MAVENSRSVSSFVACADGTVISGASLTLFTVAVNVSVTDFAPSGPLLPKSFTSIIILAVPEKSVVGVKHIPAKAALISVKAPSKFINAVPSPERLLKLDVVLNAIVPPDAVNVTSTGSVAASTSAIVMAFNVSGVSSFVLWDIGIVIVGGSLTVVTVSVNVWLADFELGSVIVIVMLPVPEASAVGSTLIVIHDALDADEMTLVVEFTLVPEKLISLSAKRLVSSDTYVIVNGSPSASTTVNFND